MSLSESQAHALAVRFQHWDRDHNGHIEWSDMEKAVARLGDAFGRPADAPERLALTASCRSGASAVTAGSTSRSTSA